MKEPTIPADHSSKDVLEAAALKALEATFMEFAEFVTTYNKDQPVPWPIAEMFVRAARSAITELQQCLRTAGVRVGGEGQQQ